MDSKRTQKEALEACKKAEFHRALSLLRASNGNIENKCATSLIVACCNSCVANVSSPENISEDDLSTFLEFVTSFMKCLSEAELLSYLQSLFFILKLLVKKKSCSTIVRLEKIIVPGFLPSNLERKHRDTYQSSASLLYNLVARCSSEKDTSCNEALVKISHIVSEIYGRVSNVNGLLSISYNCAISLVNLNISTEDTERYFLYVMNLIKSGEATPDSKDYKLFLSFFVLVLNNTLKIFSFDTAHDFYEKVLCIVEQTIKEVRYVEIFNLLRLPLLLWPSNFSPDRAKAYKNALKNLDSTFVVQVLENKLNALIYAVVISYYKQVDGQKWCEFPEEDQLEILNLLYSVGQFEQRSKYACPCGCAIQENFFQSISYSQYICTLIELSVNNGSNVTPVYHEKCSALLEKFCECVRPLVENNCEKWKKSWNSLGTSMYNIGVHLYQKSNEACLPYFYALLRYFLSYEAKTSADVLKISMIYSTFTAICCLNAKDHRTCMGFAALGVLVAYPHHTEGFVATWIKAKVGQRDAETPESQLVQRTTLASAFETFNAEIRCVTDGLVVLTPQDRVDLLTLELEQYKKRWRSKVPMMSALKELCEAADLETSVRVIIRVFGDAEMSVHDEVPRILHKVLKMYEKDRGDAMNLAMLYFLHYTYCVKDTISKNADEMERSTCFVSQSNEPPDAIPRDPTEECDIVSSYESLRLDKYSCVMKYLSRSLNLFSSTITEDFHLEILPGSMLYDTLLKISHEYRLHRHRIRSLQALQTALKVARSLNDPSRIVECIGFLIEHSDVTKSYVRDLIATADELVAEIDQSDLRPAKIVMTYHMCKARAYLYRDPEAAFGIFRAASDLYEVRDDKGELELVKCQLLLLHYRFVLMPCSLGLVDHGESTLLTVHAASAAVFEAYNKSNLGGPYEMSVLLDANEELARLYHDLRSPREVRAYCRQTVLLAQKLVLPFRCASYLVYLAHADLRSTRLDDCQVKLNGLADILQLARRAVGADVHPEPPGGRGLEKDVETITGNLQEMVLDLPVPSHYRRQLSPSSPTLVVQPFRAPAFLRHAYCECLPCVSVEYQELVLEKVRLDALINEKQGSPEIARDLFLAALDLYERYVGRAESFKLKISSIIPPDLVPELKTEFLPALVGVLLNYSYHLMRGKSKADALKTSDKLLSLLTPRKVELEYLYAEALVQKLGYLADVPKITVSFVEADVEAVPHQTDLPKTPESKQSNVTVQRTPFFSPPERVPMKNIRIKLALDEDDASDERPQKPARRLPKTPAPKIQIYANDDPKAKTPLPIFADGKKSTKKRTATGNGVFVAPSTPVVVEPSAPKNDAALKSRTKLLTERLRQSSKKVGSESNSKDENGTKNEGRRPAVRKNLLSELGGSDAQGASQGAVKRSTRQRKV